MKLQSASSGPAATEHSPLAVYSEADAGALHVGWLTRLIASAPRLGESYLDIARIIEVAKKANAEPSSRLRLSRREF